MLALTLAILAQAATPTPTATPPPDPWAEVRFMVGEWVGTSEGEPGQGSVKRTYAFVLKERFLHERNVSSYPPQPKNPKGEVHEHWSFFSYDKARKALVLRQFHQEGFVNQFALAKAAEPGLLVFESEAFENLPAGWRARESYRRSSAEAFEETFELSAPGQPFEIYSRTRFERERPRP